MYSALSQFIRGYVCNCFVGLNISCHSFVFSQSHAQVSTSLTNISGLVVAVSDLHCSLSVLWSVFSCKQSSEGACRCCVVSKFVECVQ